MTGARGMLGTALMPRLAARHDAIATDLPELDVTDQAASARIIASERPDLIIHAAAMTQVDRCEDEEELAYRVNSTGTRNVALAAENVGAAMLHVSTDFVFDGTKRTPYVEDDRPSPLSVYGASKLAGEETVREVSRRYYIVRTAWLYGAGGPNFVESILRAADAGKSLRVVDDQVGSPTWTEDLAAAIVALIGSELYGLYHVTNRGSCSWHEYACTILRLSGRGSVPVEKISSAEWGAPAMRPAWSVLGDTAWTAAGFRPLRAWDAALQEYLLTRKPANDGGTR